MEYIEDHAGFFASIFVLALVSIVVVAGAKSLENETIRAEAYAKYMGRDAVCTQH